MGKVVAVEYNVQTGEYTFCEVEDDRPQEGSIADAETLEQIIDIMEGA